MTKTKNTILHFHTRRGHSHNSGHTSFCGEKDILDVLQMRDTSNRNSFLIKENEVKIYKMLLRRDLQNLMELFEKCRDNNDFSMFEKKTGLTMGEDAYTDCNGDLIITAAEAERGLGSLEWDGEYDRDTCTLLSDCGERELKSILDSDEWNKDGLLQDFFDENTDLGIDWQRFNGEYGRLIFEYFNDPLFDINEFYEKAG